jgi:hypothetical protein
VLKAKYIGLDWLIQGSQETDESPDRWILKKLNELRRHVALAAGQVDRAPDEGKVDVRGAAQRTAQGSLAT